MQAAEATLATIRRALRGLVLLGAVGLAAELLITEHTEDFWQLVPLVLLAAGFALAALPARGSTLRPLQACLLLCVASGGIGTFLHLKAKAEIVWERVPDLGGMALLNEVLKGTSPPILAPGAMIGFGLIGLLWTWRHPALVPPGTADTPNGVSS